MWWGCSCRRRDSSTARKGLEDLARLEEKKKSGDTLSPDDEAQRAALTKNKDLNDGIVAEYQELRRGGRAVATARKGLEDLARLEEKKKSGEALTPADEAQRAALTKNKDLNDGIVAEYQELRRGGRAVAAARKGLEDLARLEEKKKSGDTLSPDEQKRFVALEAAKVDNEAAVADYHERLGVNSAARAETRIHGGQLRGRQFEIGQESLTVIDVEKRDKKNPRKRQLFYCPTGAAGNYIETQPCRRTANGKYFWTTDWFLIKGHSREGLLFMSVEKAAEFGLKVGNQS